MSSVLYQTFYPYNKFDDIQTVSELNKWMLSKEKVACLRLNNIKSNSNCLNEPASNTLPPLKHIQEEKSHLVTKNPPQFIVPDKMDTLFWCIYISHYGESQYLAIRNKYGNAEIEEKQKIVDFLKSNKNSLKHIHRKITIAQTQEIMSDLMTNSKTSLLSLVAFSVYYKKNILLLNTLNKTFLEYRYDELSITNINGDCNNTELAPWLVIKYTENKKYGFYIEEMANITELIGEYVYIMAPEKPLKGISTYKIGELVEIASKIHELAKEYPILMPKEEQQKAPEKTSEKRVFKNLSKPDLYGKIWHSLLWT